MKSMVALYSQSWYTVLDSPGILSAGYCSYLVNLQVLYSSER